MGTESKQGIVEKSGIAAVKAWQAADGKKTHILGGLLILRSVIQYTMNHDLMALMDGLVAGWGIIAGRDIIRKFEPPK